MIITKHSVKIFKLPIMYHVEKNFNFKNRTKLWASIKLIDSRFLLLPWRKMTIHTQFGKGSTLPKTPQGITPLSPIKQSPLPAFSGYIYLEIRTNHVMFNTLFSFLGHSAFECSRYLILRSPMLLSHDKLEKYDKERERFLYHPWKSE